ncbi:EAL domain-containing protein [Psychrilyobacter atlanticus]|uniref:EAL domain-containing protein n=1 Tax=Psychrilyobacter atlanticus TaxID=271091 RepID=UPI000417B380|nr:GGDEF domain-containing phosphodiesterase [Psychrilyobacter atlanticus]
MKNIVSITNYINNWINPKGFKKSIVIILILVLEIILGSIVFATGGTKYVYLHIMYFPIFLGSLIFGPLGGLSFGILGGMILGPYMPIDVSVMSMQSFSNWAVRILFFTIIGVLMGLILNLLTKHIKVINTLAFYNPITNLHNRKYFENIKLDKDTGYFLAILKIENYSKAISNLGSDMAAEILEKFSHKLKDYKNFNNSSNDKIFHFSDNEFAILLKNENSESETEEFKKISKILRHTIDLKDTKFFPEISLGVAKYNKNNLELLKEAEMARILARKNLLDFYMYIPEVSKQQMVNFELFSEIPRALKKKEFYICFHPKVNVLEKKIEGAEVLIRWLHPIKGVISPDKFIPFIETTNFINEITLFVLKEAFKALNKLRHEGININLSVNIPLKYLTNPDFLRAIKGFKSLGYPLESLEIEVLERDLIEDFDVISDAMNEIKKYGISFSLDDFGTGYSSILYIKKLPFDKIKIDQAFVRDMTTNQENQDIVKSSIQLAHIMNVYPLAEGVEDRESFDILSDFKCNYAQGYYFTKPLKLNDFIKWCITPSNDIFL